VEQRKPIPRWIFVSSVIAIITLGIALLTYSMMGLGDVSCKLCVEFKGQKTCPQAYGPTEADAKEEAIRTACAQMAGGVTEVLACHRSPVSEIECDSGY